MSLFERFLNKSNSYVYYKNNFEKLNASQKKIIKENNSLKASERKLKEENNYLKSILSENNKQIEELLIKLAIYSKQDIFNKLINNSYSELTICIKKTNKKKQRIWGDYFFALALKKSFEKHGFNVIIQEREDWYDSNVKPDINIVLRGLIEYKPNRDEINVMWNISHPDLVTDEEYESYDICFISSEKYANELNDKLNTPIKPLLQCTDPDVFYFSKQDDIAEDVLFVGITRGVYREIIKDMMKTDFDVSIYGTGWEQYVNEKYIKGQFIPNEKVHEYYSSCKILLNDHWEDMRDLDFPSNRLFDALACGTFVISDKIPSAETLFEGNVITYENAEDLNEKIKYYLSHDEERRMIAEKGKEIVLKNHTFDNRVDTIIDSLKNLLI